MKLKINRKIGRLTNMWKLNNTLLNNQRSKNKLLRKLKYVSRQMEMKTYQKKTYYKQQSHPYEGSLHFIVYKSKVINTFKKMKEFKFKSHIKKKQYRLDQ